MKRFVSILITLVLVLSFAACGNNKYVGIDKAKQTVADDIGAVLEDIEFAFNDLITDAKGDYYRLKFNKDGVDYIYEIDAMTGKILNKNSTGNKDEEMTSTSDSVVADNGNTESRTSANNSDNLLNNNDDTMMNESVTSTTSM